MWCLTLATNAIVTWTTEYHGLAVAALRRGGRHIDDAVLAHIWPTRTPALLPACGNAPAVLSAPRWRSPRDHGE